MALITDINKKLISSVIHIDDFHIGDLIRVEFKIKEGEKERLQSFEGNVISRRGRGISKSITVRKISFGEGVERIFFIYSPCINKIERLQQYKVRKSKLYYLKKSKSKKLQLSEYKSI